MTTLLPMLSSHASLHLNTLRIEGLELGGLVEVSPNPTSWRDESCSGKARSEAYDLMEKPKSGILPAWIIGELMLDE